MKNIFQLSPQDIKDLQMLGLLESSDNPTDITEEEASASLESFEENFSKIFR